MRIKRCAQGYICLLGALACAPACKSSSTSSAKEKSFAPTPLVEPQAKAKPDTAKHETLGPLEREPIAPAPPVTCDADLTNPDAVLAMAGDHYRQGEFARANACAEVATDLVPQAVEAQHLRAASLTGLSRYGDAQVAFAMALVLDPDDPETLADVADFFINILPPKRRHAVEVGLEYARRGGQQVMARRHFDRTLRGRLLVLEAEALNDLGDSTRALARVEEALEIQPELPRAEHELAVSLFHLLRFDESERAFLQRLEKQPTDAYAHLHLGLILERRSQQADADEHFRLARELAPNEFSAPVMLSEEEFREEVALAMSELTPQLRALMRHTKLEIADLPLDEDLLASTPPFAPTIMGLFRGLPAGVEPTRATDSSLGAIPARSLVLYRKNIGRSAHTREELNRQVRKTLRHEIGHLQGFDEDELRRRGLE